jgi:large subunit ribosomal protein L4
MSVPLLDKSGKAIGKVDVPAAFARDAKPALLHQAVTRHLANRRAGTADTKTRAEVRGGGRKPWRQKGTGRARHGSIRSPIWRKGGVVFGPHPRSFAITMNRRARRAALAMALAVKVKAGSLSVLDVTGLKPAKTKDIIGLLWSDGNYRTGDRVMLVVHREKDENADAVVLAARNLARAHVAGHAEVSAYSVLAHDRLLVTKAAYEALAEVCGA